MHAVHVVGFPFEQPRRASSFTVWARAIKQQLCTHKSNIPKNVDFFSTETFVLYTNFQYQPHLKGLPSDFPIDLAFDVLISFADHSSLKPSPTLIYSREDDHSAPSVGSGIHDAGHLSAFFVATRPAWTTSITRNA